jgi:hypothetical protein
VSQPGSHINKYEYFQLLNALIKLKYILIRETFYVFLSGNFLCVSIKWAKVVHEKTVKDSKAQSSRLIITYHSDNKHYIYLFYFFNLPKNSKGAPTEPKLQ